MTAEYEESQCTFFGLQNSDGGAERPLERSDNVWHYNEVCLGSSKISTDCANRLYVFERIPGFRLEPAASDKEIAVSNRTECEDLCLNMVSHRTMDLELRKCVISSN
jgi:hypothetical protein